MTDALVFDHNFVVYPPGRTSITSITSINDGFSMLILMRINIAMMCWIKREVGAATAESNESTVGSWT